MMTVKRELKVDATSQPTFFFVFGPTSLCTNAPSPKKIGDRKILFFLKGGGGCTQARHPGPTRYGFSLLRVTEDEVLYRMQADALKIYACDCTSHPINLWRPVSSVVTERKGSRHLCHLSNPSHQSHPSHPSLQSHLIILVTR